MSEALSDLIQKELDVLGTELASRRMSAGDTRVWAVAVLTEAAYCLRAVRAAGLMTAGDVTGLMIDAVEVALSEPSKPVQVVQSLGCDKGGKPN